MRICIVGNGYVGKATSLLENKRTEVFIYDIDESKCVPRGLKFSKLSLCNIVFICVPTPSKPSGECHTNIVSDVIDQLNSLDESPYIIVKSTVPVGFCEYHGVNFMQEFNLDFCYLHHFCCQLDYLACRLFYCHFCVFGTSAVRPYPELACIFLKK